MKKELEYYDPDNSKERCTAAGIVEFKCGDKWYNPLKQVCDNDSNSFKIGTLEVCGGKVYINSPSGEEQCENNVLLITCGDEYYNEQTHYCDWNNITDTGKVKPRDPSMFCSGIPFTLSEYSKCDNGVIKERCGDATWYNYNTEYCYRDEVKSTPKCGGMYMNGYEFAYGHERCAADGKTLEYKCNDSENPLWHNPITKTCSYDGSSLKDKTKCSK